MLKHTLLFGTVLLFGATSELPAQVAVIGSATHERQAVPGETYEGTIVVENTTAVPQVARVYQTDYRFFADGRTMFDAPGSTGRSSAPWLTVAPGAVTLPAGATVRLHYRVAVPHQATDSLHGTYWSVIMVEGAGQAGQDGATRQPAVALGTTVRHAVQVVTHIGGTGAPRVGFTAPTVTTEADSGRSLQVDLSNDGDRAHRLEVVLELFTENGAPVGTVRSTRGLLYPGTSLRQRFALDSLPAGTYRALVVADAGADAVFGAQYTLTF